MKSSDLESRVEHLEELNRWHLNAMNTLVMMNDMHGKTKNILDVTSVFEDIIEVSD